MLSKDVRVLSTVKFRVWCHIVKPLRAIKIFLAVVVFLCFWPYLRNVDALAPMLNVLVPIVLFTSLFGFSVYTCYALYVLDKCATAVNDDPLFYINKYGQEFLKVD